MGAGPVLVVLGVVVVIALIWYFDPLGTLGSGGTDSYTGSGLGGSDRGAGSPRQ